MTKNEAIEILSNELTVITDIIAYCKDFEKESDLALAYRAKRQKAHKMAISALEEIQQQRENGWIPAEEQNPEVGQYVLGTNEYREVLIYHYGWNSPHTRKMFFHLCGSAAKIIAWRPIPEPYIPTKGDANGKE